MTDQGTVSTSDTPPPRNEISVVTEENAATLAPDPNAAPPGPGESNTSDSAPPKSEPNADKQPRRRNRSAERKISSLTRKLEAAESTVAEQSPRITALETQIADLQKANPPPKPRLKDFKNEDEFGVAISKWTADSEAAAKPPPKAPAPKAPAAKKPDADAIAHAKEVDDLEEAGEKLYGDEFEEVLHDDSLPLSAAMAEIIFDSEKGPELIMWLDEHHDEGRDMFRMRPAKLARELKKIEDGLEKATAMPSSETPLKGEKNPTAKEPVAQAKPPGDPVKGDGPDKGAQGVVNGLSMDDYASRRRATERSQHRN